LCAAGQSITAQPSLGFATAGNQASLNWPAEATNFILQSATDLASPNWVTVTNATPGTNLPVAYDSPARFFRLYQAPIVPAGMALIPAGAFTMGNVLDESDIGDAYPTNVNVSAFYMDVTLVRYDHWQTVYNWATNQGYLFYSTGLGKASNHPVAGISWYDAVNWCNARSQQEGLTPVYYSDPSFTQVYTNANGHGHVYPNWSTSGYRLPTEAEWEKASRGGLSGHRFPWGDTIAESQANYFGYYHDAYSWDFGPFGYNATFSDGVSPYTSPVGYFAPNGYGLFDMAGNLKQWCWDWYGAPPYDSGSAYLGGTDPHGSTSTQSQKVLRGGDWSEIAIYARCAARFQNDPLQAQIIMGFRCVRGH
jgi:formylglycine-generating enzyme required for sulfatase activity